jgi:hypothetical protein
MAVQPGDPVTTTVHIESGIGAVCERLRERDDEGTTWCHLRTDGIKIFGNHRRVNRHRRGSLVAVLMLLSCTGSVLERIFQPEITTEAMIAGVCEEVLAVSTRVSPGMSAM